FAQSLELKRTKEEERRCDTIRSRGGTKSQMMKVTVLALLFGVAPLAAQTDWAVVKTFPVGGQGSWDYLTVDPQTHRLYVPRTTHTLVIDSESGSTIADIPGQKIAHGVAIVPRS